VIATIKLPELHRCDVTAEVIEGPAAGADDGLADGPAAGIPPDVDPLPESPPDPLELDPDELDPEELELDEPDDVSFDCASVSLLPPSSPVPARTAPSVLSSADCPPTPSFVDDESESGSGSVVGVQAVSVAASVHAAASETIARHETAAFRSETLIEGALLWLINITLRSVKRPSFQ